MLKTSTHCVPQRCHDGQGDPTIQKGALRKTYSLCEAVEWTFTTRPYHTKISLIIHAVFGQVKGHFILLEHMFRVKEKRLLRIAFAAQIQLLAEFGICTSLYNTVSVWCATIYSNYTFHAKIYSVTIIDCFSLLLTANSHGLLLELFRFNFICYRQIAHFL